MVDTCVDKTNAGGRDPLKYLNNELINMILLLLPPEDVVYFQSVSRLWRDCLESWMSAAGLRAHFPRHRKDSQCLEPASAVQKYKSLAYKPIYMAYRERALRRGCATLYRKFKDGIEPMICGNFAVGLERGKRGKSDSLFWQCIIPGYKGIDAQRKTVDLELAFKHTRNQIRVLYTMINSDGLVLLQIRAKEISIYEDWIYSTTEDKMTLLRAPREADRISPLLISVNRAYYIQPADTPDKGAYMIAYDIKTTELIYRVKLDFAGNGIARSPLLIPGDDEKIVFNLAYLSVGPLSHGPQMFIVNGADGRTSQSFGGFNQLSCDLMIECDGSFAVVFRSCGDFENGMGPTNRQTFKFALVQKYHYDTTTSCFVQSPVDAILFPSHSVVCGSGADIEPFSLKIFHLEPEACLISNLEETEDTDITDMVKRAVESKAGQVEIGSYYIPVNPTDITVPRLHHDTQVILDLPRKKPWMKFPRFRDGGRLSIFDDERPRVLYLLDFNRPIADYENQRKV